MKLPLNLINNILEITENTFKITERMSKSFTSKLSKNYNYEKFYEISNFDLLHVYSYTNSGSDKNWAYDWT